MSIFSIKFPCASFRPQFVQQDFVQQFLSESGRSPKSCQKWSSKIPLSQRFFWEFSSAFFFSPIENESRPLSAKNFGLDSDSFTIQVCPIFRTLFLCRIFNGVSGNGSGLCDGGAIEAQIFNFVQKVNRRTMVELCSFAPLLRNPCCAMCFFISFQNF